MTLNEEFESLHKHSFESSKDAVDFVNGILETHCVGLIPDKAEKGEGFYRVIDENGHLTDECLYVLLEAEKGSFKISATFFTNEEEDT